LHHCRFLDADAVGLQPFGELGDVGECTDAIEVALARHVPNQLDRSATASSDPLCHCAARSELVDEVRQRTSNEASVLRKDAAPSVLVQALQMSRESTTLGCSESRRWLRMKAGQRPNECVSSRAGSPQSMLDSMTRQPSLITPSALP
jgi:hypothetical protein